jgi:hypothetical protein
MSLYEKCRALFVVNQCSDMGKKIHYCKNINYSQITCNHNQNVVILLYGLE